MKHIFSLIALLCAAEVFGQDQHGTVVVLARSSHKIVVAADSRRTDRGQHFDDECKIRRLNKTLVFTAAGKKSHTSDGHPEFTWNSFQVAMEVAKRMRGTSNPAEQIATEWARQVTALHNMDAARGVIEKQLLSKECIENAIVAGYQGSSPVVYGINICKTHAASGPTYAPKVGVETVPDDGTVIPAMGETDIVGEFVSGKTEHGRAWLDDFHKKHPPSVLNWDTVMVPFLQKSIELSMEYSINKDDIGGDIDVVEIFPTRVHWVNRKSNCTD